MKTRLFVLIALIMSTQAGEALACSVCFGAKDAKSTQNMAVAIWVMLGAIMSVLGGVGAFTFRIWRHASTPLAPHQELAEEDLKQYE